MSRNNAPIHVSICSYRDPDLPNTVNSLIENHSNDGDGLSIHILNQYCEKTSPFNVLKSINRKKAKIKIHGVEYSKTKGVCWARHLMQKEWNGEDYFLMLDSHHRFRKNYNLDCINTLEDTEKIYNEKVILTNYLASFDPYDENKTINESWQLNFDRFVVGGGTNPDGIIFTIPSTMENFKKRKTPRSTAFFSAHFMFSRGSVCKECVYDPNLWFHGEEQSYATRLYTHGYNLKNIHLPVAFHFYERRGRTKVWDDNSFWVDMDRASNTRYRQLFYMEPRTIDFGEFDFGTERTLQDYEKFAGIHFKSRSVHPDTLACKEPPMLYNYKKYDDFVKACRPVRRHCLDVWHEDMPDYEKIDFVAVIYEHNGRQLFREDFSGVKLEAVFAEKKDKGDSFFKFWSDFISPEKDRYNFPTNAVVWPSLKKEGWGRRLDFNLKN